MHVAFQIYSTQTPTHAQYSDTPTHTHTCTHVTPHLHTHIIHSYTLVQTLTTHKCARAHAYTHTHLCTPCPLGTLSRNLLGTAHTHTHTHTRAHTRAHTHALNQLG